MNNDFKDFFKKNNIISILLFLGIMFVAVFISGFFSDSEISPLKLAFSVTAIFAAFYIITIGGVVIINWASSKALQFSKLSKDDFIFNPNLYRDIIEKYSPAILYYIDNMEYNYEYIVTSNLLSLVNKKYIEIDGEKINIIKYDYYNLDLSEKFVIENIRNNKVDIDRSNQELKELVEEEGIRKGLLLKKKLNWLKIFRYLIIFFVIFNLVYPISIFFLSKIINIDLQIIENIGDTIESSIGIIFTLVWIFLCFFVNNFQANPYIRTDKAKEINMKLEGLKEYLKNYSMLDERKSQEIKLWEDYLIYSVIFKQNKNILKEYKKFY